MSVNVFLDRDGTLIEDVGYMASPNDIRPLPGVFEGLQMLTWKNCQLHIVSNQSGLARGKFTLTEFEDVESRFKEIFRENGITFRTMNYCFHLPTEDCTCRKPKVGLFEQVNAVVPIDKRLAAMIGNSPTDREAAESFGISYWDVNPPNAIDGSRNYFKNIVEQISSHFDEVSHEVG